MVLDLKQLIQQYDMNIMGILHVGAHTLEEKEIYDQIDTVTNVIWVESNADLAYAGTEKVRGNLKQIVVNATIADEDDKKMSFHITNNLASSSLLELGTHIEKHPSVKHDKTIPVLTKTIDRLAKELPNPFKTINFINLDIQGAELLALKGTKETLPQINYIYTEVNVEYLYQGCCLMHEIDEYLTDFKRVETKIYPSKGWGDALYIRKSCL